jgi:hypothetical protein
MYPFSLGIDLHIKHTCIVLVDTKYMQICESPFLVWMLDIIRCGHFC